MEPSNIDYWGKVIRRPSILQRFFIICSGTNINIIYQCPTEWNKYAGIGATIFFTACLASLSGGYAINFVFENVAVSIAFGVFWALVIFNLDRYIVLSLRKEKIPVKTDILMEIDVNRKLQLKSERKRLKWQQVLMASPRFFIALVIALSVSKPIELRLFNNRIEKELENIAKTDDNKFEQEETNRNKALTNQLTAINKQEENDKIGIFNNNPIYSNASKEIPSLEKQIEEKYKLIAGNKIVIKSNSRMEIRKETVTDTATGQPKIINREVRVLNNAAKRALAANNQLVDEKQRINSQLGQQKSKQATVADQLNNLTENISAKYESAKKSIQQQIDDLSKTYLLRKLAWENANKRSSDLPARLEALGNISKIFNPIWWASITITTLFILLETAPIVVKLLTKRGPYDEMLDAEEYAIFIEQSRKIDELNRTINVLIEKADEAAKLSGENFISTKKDELGKQLIQNQEILNKIAAYQKELADIYIDNWYEVEKAKALQQFPNYQQSI